MWGNPLRFGVRVEEVEDVDDIRGGEVKGVLAARRWKKTRIIAALEQEKSAEHLRGDDRRRSATGGSKKARHRTASAASVEANPGLACCCVNELLAAALDVRPHQDASPAKAGQQSFNSKLSPPPARRVGKRNAAPEPLLSEAEPDAAERSIAPDDRHPPRQGQPI